MTLSIMQVTWGTTDVQPYLTSSDVDAWWNDIEKSILDSLIYQNTHQAPLEAYKVAPWIVPAMRNSRIYNTEYLKGDKTHDNAEGCPKQLASAIRSGKYNPLKVQYYTLEQVKEICRIVNLSVSSQSTKVSIHV